MNTDYEFIESPRDGMLLTGVKTIGAFSQAGLLDGDIVVRIAGERIKDNNDVSDGLHKAIRDESFEVQFYRGSEKMTTQVPRTFRNTAGPLPEPSKIVGPNNPNATTIVQNELSVAEELAKFAELHEQGVLTDEEFAAQKAKLLAR